jgi:hypothetical protein
VTWEFDEQVSWLEVRVVPDVGDRTRLELEHIAHVSEDLWAQFGPGAVGIGWDLALLGLAQHLSDGEPLLTPETAPAWYGSGEGVEFVMASAERWYAADVASGQDAQAARAATDRVKAAYTAPPEDAR